MNTIPYETIEGDPNTGVYATVYQDIFGDSCDPREHFENLGTMVCCHPRYDLGDVQVDSSEAFWNHLEEVIRDTGDSPRCAVCGHLVELSYGEWIHYDYDQMCEGTEDLDAKMEALDDDHEGRIDLDRYMVWLSLDLYDHSGLSMTTSGGFVGDSARWDTSSVGIIYVTHKQVQDMRGSLGLPKWSVDEVLKILRGEVDTYSMYLSGDVYYYEVTHNGETVDAMGGLYGHDEAEQAALDAWRSYVDDLRAADLADLTGVNQ